MAVRLRMKKLGRRHRPFFRVVAVDSRSARDGKVIEYLGYYDPMVKETDARARLNADRIDYWLGVGAQPSDKVGVLIKKYGTNGTHLAQQQAALEQVRVSKPTAPPAMPVPKPKVQEAADAPATEATSEVDAETNDAAESVAVTDSAADETSEDNG